MIARRSKMTKWSPLIVAAAAALVMVVLFLAPLPGLLLVGLWLVCPLLMIGMHVSGRHHPSRH
jgi:amino acid transporter